MKLQIHSIHFDADQKLLTFIKKKLDKLETYYDRIIDGEVFLRLEKGDFAKENKVIEVKINLPGNHIFAKEQAISFETATDTALDSLTVQLKKYKDKLIKH